MTLRLPSEPPDRLAPGVERGGLPAMACGHLGISTLRLLAQGAAVRLLRELADGPLRPSELDERLPEVAHSALMRRLAELVQAGAVGHERSAGLPPRARYSLTEAGRALLAIPAASERWERQWSSGAREEAPGVWALRLLADERARAIVRALADEPLPPSDLECLPGVGRSAARRRLGPLLLNGILLRNEEAGRVHYALTAGARRLGLVKMLAARWEWRWARPDHPPPAWDLPGHLRLLAPATRVPETLAGVCRVHIDSHGARQTVDLAARDGRLVALPSAPEHAPHATGHAPAHVWCEALLHRRIAGIAKAGDWTLMADMLSGVSAVLGA